MYNRIYDLKMQHWGEKNMDKLKNMLEDNKRKEDERLINSGTWKKRETVMQRGDRKVRNQKQN